jgi:hypothetical protein
MFHRYKALINFSEKIAGEIPEETDHEREKSAIRRYFYLAVA